MAFTRLLGWPSYFCFICLALFFFFLSFFCYFITLSDVVLIFRKVNGLL